MALIYHQADERPYWQATVTVDGIADDMTTGYTFGVYVSPASSDVTATLTKTTGIIGAAAGLVTVAWAVGELDITPGFYAVELTATRSSDSKDWTVADTLQVLPRLKP